MVGGAAMTRKELQLIANLLWKSDMNNYNDAMLKAEEIYNMLREEGYKSPEEVATLLWSMGFKEEGHGKS
jgi:mRNA-degrading endonuclease HigB of HigAB toxin-antitoxin module